VPNLTIILNHLGGLTRVGPFANRDEEILANWRRGIAAVAECPNVNLKLGGIGMPRLGFDWHTRLEELAAAIAPIMSYCIEQFGPERQDKVGLQRHDLVNVRRGEGTPTRLFTTSLRRAHDVAGDLYKAVLFARR
jgi:hypothetical protein